MRGTAKLVESWPRANTLSGYARRTNPAEKSEGQQHEEAGSRDNRDEAEDAGEHHNQRVHSGKLIIKLKLACEALS